MSINSSEFSNVSPMMQHYLKTKEEYSDCLLFYRLGDFYELFFDDAETVSRELELTLTGKSCGLKERAPMCGVPYHAVDVYITRLVEKGYKVAICEQMEDPKLAKGMVKREVTRIVTPGTNTSMQALDEKENNYIFSVFYDAAVTGIAVADVSTGDFYCSQLSDQEKLVDELFRYDPSEIICNEAFALSAVISGEVKERLKACVNTLDAHYFSQENCTGVLKEHFKVSNLLALGIDELRAGTIASGALLRYLYDTQKNSLSNITRIEAYLSGKYMLLDSATRRNLELTRTLRDKNVRGSLLWVLDRTKTAMGARLLRQFLEQPLIQREEILRRHDAVECLSQSSVDRDEIREYLQPVYDLERLTTRVSYGSANPRDVLALRESLRMIAPLKNALSALECAELKRVQSDLCDFTELVRYLDSALVDEPPLAMKEGGIIKEGFSGDIDHFREAKTQGRQWLAQLEETDRNRTGIKNLRIKYNNVFGYFFEVTNSFKDLVPDDFIRKQTLVGSERYTTAKLKELEDTILNAEDKLNDLEYEAFCAMRDAISDRITDIQKSAKAIALLDVYCSLSLAAERNHYVRPHLNDSGVIKITGGRHPVVEQMMEGEFISNDTMLDNKKNSIAVITGPNMAGKSTYMRQVALIMLMSQIGSFVPAQSADICVVDRIFTRVGASDDLGSGQSTFMVEMNEVANILRNATSKSLLILDEIGRGTSTFDGLSIAWAVIEYISNKKHLGAKTLFATHYHELTELEGKMDNVNNYCIAVREKGDDIIFLRKIIRGGADKSYGIQVARLAGIPDIVIDRAREIVAQLSDNDITEKIQNIEVRTGEGQTRREKVKHYDEVDLGQMSLFETSRDEDVIRSLKDIDITNMTPMDALNTLYRLQSMLNNRWSS